MAATPTLSSSATVAIWFMDLSYFLEGDHSELVLLPLVQAEPQRETGHGCHNFFLGADITNLRKAWRAGDPAALDQLSKRVYDELRLMAHRHVKNERQGNTLQTTALVHEVYLRLIDVTKVEWQQRAQFFAMAAQMMRRILVDAARAGASHKRGAGAEHLNFDDTAAVSPEPDGSMVALDDALAAFAQIAPRQAKVVELRFFGGLKEEEINGGSQDLAPHRSGATGSLPGSGSPVSSTLDCGEVSQAGIPIPEIS
jgi:RNA polymerase sigma factor (TIGR02999 family)